MIDTAYTLTSFPSASSTLPAQIRFRSRTSSPRAPYTPAAPPMLTRVPARLSALEPAVYPAQSDAPQPVASRGRTSYFIAGMALLFVLIQAAAWLPLEGIDLLFVRIVLFAGAGICFLASGDDAVSAPYS
ncbi:MAG: hypothetical protein SH809_01560 [Rhodothermales bacterium]|nr:hypothetical protein [Rhodothermales bacterium]